MSLSADQMTIIENIQARRLHVAQQLRTARRLQRQGDIRGDEFLKRYKDSVEQHGHLFVNPNRRAALLQRADSYKRSMQLFLDSANGQETPHNQEVLALLRAEIANYEAIAQAAPF